MSRLIDHLVLATPDLDGLAGRFSALGFTVGSRNRHPWGTENRLIQLADQSFLELITLGEGATIPEHRPGHFSFGAFVRDALARRQTGLIMLALASADARADAAAFAEAGIGAFEPFDFGRKGRRPDGSEVEVAFTLAFAASRAMPEAGFFVCQQHFPQNFWSETAQKHANGALGLARITLVAENPLDHHIFLSAFTGTREIRATSTGIELLAGRTAIEVLTAEGYARRYGRQPHALVAPRFAGFGIRIETRQKPVENIAFQPNPSEPHGRVSIEPASGSFDVDLLFEEERPP